MHANRPPMVKQLIGLALVAVLMTACGSGTPADVAVFDQVRDLGQDLNRAVSASQDAATGFAEPQFAARAIERASNASRRLAETATAVRTPDLRSASGELVSIANRIVTHLTQSDVEAAESLRANSFVPLASQVAQMKSSLPSSSLTQDDSGGASVGVAFVIVVFVVAGVATMLIRGRPRPVADTSTVATGQPSAPAATPSNDRSWDEPHPLYAPPPVIEPLVGDTTDAARSTRKRPIDVELQSLLSATIDQALERDWQVSLVCPEVHVSGDPVRVQRAILATLGNVFLQGAELVGIVVDVVDGHVLLSIGHDAPIDDRAAEDIAIRLADQLATAIDQPEVGWSVAADGDIYLTTVSAGTELVIETEAGVSA